MFGLDDLLGGLVGGAMKMFSNAQTNEYAKQNAAQTQQYTQQNMQQAQTFNAQQQLQSQEYNAAQADISRQWSAGQQQQAEQFNASQAQLNRDYQTQMSNSAYQRATADMKAAGLNPILAYQQGGASTPGGSSGSIGAVGGSTASSSAASIGAPGGATVAPRVGLLSGAITAAGELARLQPSIDQAKAEAKNTEDTNRSIFLDQQTKLQDRNLRDQQHKTEIARTETQEAQTDLTKAQTAATYGSRSKVGGVDTDYFGNKIVEAGRIGTEAVGNAVSSAKKWWELVHTD